MAPPKAEMASKGGGPPQRRELNHVADLWDGKSPYHYEVSACAEYIKSEREGLERVPQ